ncbi:MAG: gliding motility protein GldM [Muribaculaceae bacterium]|nr:gliding motility protein GldM [Muribaculaceae bacterium]
MSPRQRMINLMYIVLTAMLALNVSSDVLNGFNQVHDGLVRTNETMAAKNEIQYVYLQELYQKNPTKVGPWLEKGTYLRNYSTSLLNEIDSLKLAIAQKADGKKGDPENLVNLDDLEAAGVVMLNPSTNSGRHLKEQIDQYRVSVAELITDPQKRDAVLTMLSTQVKDKQQVGATETWEEQMFDNMPAVAAVTMLSKLQSDIREAESEALTNLITNVDIGDVRVNELNPYVIPNSNMVMRGGRYVADIVLAAIDTTQRPAIFVDGNKIENGHLELIASSVGNHAYSGYIEVARGDGSIDRRPFSSSYTVMEPMATISPTMMNVLYAGIDNPVSISVPGVAMNAVEASMTNGSLVRNGDSWVARPGQIGQDAVISVFASMDGNRQQVGSMTFRVRQLPDPAPFIPIKDAQGNLVNYKGTPKKISKQQLMEAESIGAAIDDGILNVSFTVESFSTIFYDSMGNAIPEVSDGNRFSSRQKEQFRRLKPGARFFISNVKAKGPDGISRVIYPLEVSLN